MKRTIAGLIAGLVLGTSATAVAATTGWSHQGNGVWCKTQAGSVACVPLSGDGYGVAINGGAILVMDLDSSRTVFKRYQP